MRPTRHPQSAAFARDGCGDRLQLVAILRSITINMLLKQMKIPVIFSKVKDQIHKEILEQDGHLPSSIPKIRWASSLPEPSCTNIWLAPRYLRLRSLVEIEIPEKFFGKSLSEAEILAKYGLVIAIKRRKKFVDENGENQSSVCDERQTQS